MCAGCCSYSYSDPVPLQGKATSQKSSGRCWIFACLNVIRLNLQKKFNLDKDFELSQSYLYFFDKLERCQFFFDNILATADEPLSGRMLAHLLQSPLNDGGQWDMLVNLVQKYGLVPKVSLKILLGLLSERACSSPWTESPHAPGVTLGCVPRPALCDCIAHDESFPHESSADICSRPPRVGGVYFAQRASVRFPRALATQCGQRPPENVIFLGPPCCCRRKQAMSRHRKSLKQKQPCLRRFAESL